MTQFIQLGPPPGFGGLALSALLGDSLRAASTEPTSFDCKPKPAHFPGKAKAVIHGRLNVSCEDIRELALPVFRHRLFTTFAADSLVTDSAAGATALASRRSRGCEAAIS